MMGKMYPQSNKPECEVRVAKPKKKRLKIVASYKPLKLFHFLTIEKRKTCKSVVYKLVQNAET